MALVIYCITAGWKTEYIAPLELGDFHCGGFYNYSAPTALREGQDVKRATHDMRRLLIVLEPSKALGDGQDRLTALPQGSCGRFWVKNL